MAASSRKKPRSFFDLPSSFFDSCRVLLSPSISCPCPCPSPTLPPPYSSAPPSEREKGEEAAAAEEEEGSGLKSNGEKKEAAAAPRWSCNTCKSEFESLHDQRSHFKSDLHRLNVKLSIAGKKTIKEEAFDEAADGSLFEDLDVSSISGSEDEFEKGSIPNSGMPGKGREGDKQKLYVHLQSGETISFWRSLMLNESEEVLLEKNGKSNLTGDTGHVSYLEESELIKRLKLLIHEPRDKTCLRVVLLASGGHFAGCVFDGNSIVAHKTFHRYVVRAKSGKTQSSKDATGKTAHSGGSSIRRHNEAALKKEIHELLVTWKPYMDSSSCIFVYAPSKNRQMLFDGEELQFGSHGHAIRHIPLTVHRPTLKEAKRIYNILSHISYEVEGDATFEEVSSSYNNEGNINQQSKVQLEENLVTKESSPGAGSFVEILPSDDENSDISPYEHETTPLHEATNRGDAQQILELLEQGLDPCIKDARGRTPYMLATEKEVRNTFRRYMASNLDKWDWHAANVPSALTKEMEESQAAKQAEKDAKRKAKAKELKKLRKAKEKAKSEAAKLQNAQTTAPQGQAANQVSSSRQQPRSNGAVAISKEEEQRRALAAEREKRAAAAERRIAAMNASLSSSETRGGACDVLCSCCNVSLAGKVPFHRYNYKYCSTSCMHAHKEMLEDG